MVVLRKWKWLFFSKFLQLIFACEKNLAVSTFIFLVAKLRPQEFRMIYSIIEVDGGLNMCGKKNLYLYQTYQGIC